jgi:hypothetical protein
MVDGMEEEMKQHITSDQWKEISEKQRDIMIDEWIFNHPLEVFSLPTIGQMIEFLDEHNEFFALEKLTVFSFVLNDGENGGIVNKEPCDALWEAVKEVLNK